MLLECFQDANSYLYVVLIRLILRPIIALWGYRRPKFISSRGRKNNKNALKKDKFKKQ